MKNPYYIAPKKCTDCDCKHQEGGKLCQPCKHNRSNQALAWRLMMAKREKDFIEENPYNW